MESYCPNLKNKNFIIVKNIVGKHSMSANEWEPKKNVEKGAYGLESTLS